MSTRVLEQGEEIVLLTKVELGTKMSATPPVAKSEWPRSTSLTETDRQTYRQTDRHTYRQAETDTDRRANRQPLFQQSCIFHLPETPSSDFIAARNFSDCCVCNKRNYQACLLFEACLKSGYSID